jgi:hypothetical protein
MLLQYGLLPQPHLESHPVLQIYACESTGITLLATASKDEVCVWHAMSKGMSRYHKRKDYHCPKVC